ncbi:unnamed protein product [Caenorhabditis bovis]|uniref:Zinc finger PHD-type domain-containing protein n=1 Tax=Caenorhabditis bovis TaxID=2654633 RepID=A0A8S1EDD9_9PELO|nr:unnamed protein product [Caenorhabditis bovis]
MSKAKKKFKYDANDGLMPAGGNILCCDVCPASFHLICLGINENDVPEGQWMCNRCAHTPVSHRFQHTPSTSGIGGSIPHPEIRAEKERLRNEEAFRLQLSRETDKFTKKLKWPCKELLNALRRVNPTEFVLDADIVKEHVPLPYDLIDKARDEVFNEECYYCGGKNPYSPMLKCDFCPLFWHVDCVRPPLTIKPTWRLWMCPAHVEHTIDKLCGGRLMSETLRMDLWKSFKNIDMSKGWTKELWKKTAMLASQVRQQKMIEKLEETIQKPRVVELKYPKIEELDDEQKTSQLACVAEFLVLKPVYNFGRRSMKGRRQRKKNPTHRLMDQVYQVKDDEQQQQVAEKKRKKSQYDDETVIDAELDELDRQRSIPFTDQELYESIAGPLPERRQEFLANVLPDEAIDSMRTIARNNEAVLGRNALWAQIQDPQEHINRNWRNLNVHSTIRNGGIEAYRPLATVEKGRKKAATDGDLQLLAFGYPNDNWNRRMSSQETEAYIARCPPVPAARHLTTRAELRLPMYHSQREFADTIGSYFDCEPNYDSTLVLVFHDHYFETERQRLSFRPSGASWWSRDTFRRILAKRQAIVDDYQPAPFFDNREDDETVVNEIVGKLIAHVVRRNARRPKVPKISTPPPPPPPPPPQWKQQQQHSRRKSQGEVEKEGKIMNILAMAKEEELNQSLPPTMTSSTIAPTSARSALLIPPLTPASRENYIHNLTWSKKAKNLMKNGARNGEVASPCSSSDSDRCAPSESCCPSAAVVDDFNQSGPLIPEIPVGEHCVQNGRKRSRSTSVKEQSPTKSQPNGTIDSNIESTINEVVQNAKNDLLDDTIRISTKRFITLDPHGPYVPANVLVKKANPWIRESNVGYYREMVIRMRNPAPHTRDHDYCAPPELETFWLTEIPPRYTPDPVDPNVIIAIHHTPTSVNTLPSTCAPSATPTPLRGVNPSRKRGRPPGSRNKKDGVVPTASAVAAVGVAIAANGNDEATTTTTTTARKKRGRPKGSTNKQNSMDGSRQTTPEVVDGPSTSARPSPPPPLPPAPSATQRGESPSRLWSAEKRDEMRREAEAIKEKYKLKIIARSKEMCQADWFNTRDQFFRAGTIADFEYVRERVDEARRHAEFPLETRYLVPNYEISAIVRVRSGGGGAARRTKFAIQRGITKIGFSRECHILADRYTTHHCPAIQDHHCDLIFDKIEHRFYLSVVASARAIVDNVVICRKMGALEKDWRAKMQANDEAEPRVRCECEVDLRASSFEQKCAGVRVETGSVELRSGAVFKIGCAEFELVFPKLR